MHIQILGGISVVEHEKLVQIEQSNVDKAELVDWWVGTVVLAFFPMIISVITSLCRYGNVDINRMIGDGELIISAFLITTPSLINYYKETTKKTIHKKIFYLLLFAAFFQLTAYTSIKTTPHNIPCVVYITSAICVISSVIIAWQGEKYLQRGNI